MLERYLKPTILLIAAIILCSVLARTLSGNETLAEYAQNHPEVAYKQSDSKGDSNLDKQISDGNSSTSFAK